LKRLWEVWRERQNENTTTGNTTSPTRLDMFEEENDRMRTRKKGCTLGRNTTIHLIEPSQCLGLALEASALGCQGIGAALSSVSGRNQDIVLLEGALAGGNWEVVLLIEAFANGENCCCFVEHRREDTREFCCSSGSLRKEIMVLCRCFRSVCERTQGKRAFSVEQGSSSIES
jgi:hypothetical protein